MSAGTAAAEPAGRVRVGALLVGAMAAALVAGRLETALAALAVAGAGAGWAGAGWPRARWVAGVAGAMGVAIGLNLWLVDGRALPLPAIAGRAATAEGARLGVLLALRLAGASLALHGLRAAWPGTRAADEVARALAPLERARVPVRDVHAVLTLALRVAPLLGDEVRRIARVQEARAGRPARTFGRRLTRARATLVPALTGALERAEQMALALEARHWRARPLPPGTPARAWGVAGAALFVVALCWRSG